MTIAGLLPRIRPQTEQFLLPLTILGQANGNQVRPKMSVKTFFFFFFFKYMYKRLKLVVYIDVYLA